MTWINTAPYISAH